MTDFQEAFKEIMDMYIQKKQEWISFFGDENGFDEWFSKKVGF